MERFTRATLRCPGALNRCHLPLPHRLGAMERRALPTVDVLTFEGSDYANREANFGVFRFDDSPKPAACALGSLIWGVAPAGC